MQRFQVGRFFLLLPILWACGKGEQTEQPLDPNTNSLKIEFGDQKTLAFSGAGDTFAAGIEFIHRNRNGLTCVDCHNEGGYAAALVGTDTPAPNFQIFHLSGSVMDTTSPYAGSQISLRAKITGVGVYQGDDVDSDLVIKHAKSRPDKYLHQKAVSTHTQARLEITDYDEATGFVAGNFELDLCLVESLNTNTCENALNRLPVKGSFANRKQISPREFQPEGTIDAPVELDYWTLSHRPYVVTAVDSFFATTLPSSVRLALIPYAIGSEVKISLYDSNGFQTPICTLESSQKNAECVVETDASVKRLYIRATKLSSNAYAFIGIDARVVKPWISQGTAENPIIIDLPLPVSYAGTVSGTDRSYYRISVPKNQAVKISLQGITGVVRGLIQENGQRAQCHAISRLSSIPPVADNVCIVKTASGLLDLKISPSSRQVDGDKFLFKVETHDVYYPNQGDSRTPVAINDAAPFLLDATVDSASYYTWQGEKDTVYTFSFSKPTSSSYLSMYVDGETDPILGYRQTACSTNSDEASCAAKSATGKFYITVWGRYGQGTRFQWGVKPGGVFYASERRQIEGTTPLSIDGSVGATTSQYTFTVTPGNTYSAALRKHENRDITMTVNEFIRLMKPATIRSAALMPAPPPPFSEGGGGGGGGAGGGRDVSNATTGVTWNNLCRERFLSPTESICTFVAETSETTIDVRVYTGSGGGTFTLTLTDGGTLHSADGTTDEPVALTEASFPYNGSVNYRGSYYRLDLEPNGMRKITLTPHDQATNLTIRDRDGNYLCSQLGIGQSPLVCEFQTNSENTYVRIEVTPASGADGGKYTLTIE